MYTPSGGDTGESLGAWAKESIYGALFIAAIGVACIAYGVTYAFTGGTSPVVMNWVPAFGAILVLTGAWFVAKYHAGHVRRLVAGEASE